MRRTGKTHQQILEIQKDIESGTTCYVYGMKDPQDYIKRLNDLGTKVFATKVDKDYYKFVLDDSL